MEKNFTLTFYKDFAEKRDFSGEGKEIECARGLRGLAWAET